MNKLNVLIAGATGYIGIQLINDIGCIAINLVVCVVISSDIILISNPIHEIVYNVFSAPEQVITRLSNVFGCLCLGLVFFGFLIESHQFIHHFQISTIRYALLDFLYYLHKIHSSRFLRNIFNF